MRKVKVKDLRAGDQLASGALITHSPHDSVRCPKGKINLGVKYPKEEKGFLRVWGKETIVEVIDQPVEG